MKKLSLHAGLQAETYRTLQKLDCISHDKLTQILNNNGVANLTVCPVCKIDDFIHVEDCPLQPTRENVRKWNKLGELCK